MIFNINPAGGGGGIQTVKLKEVTTSAAAAQVEFDLSDIDLDRYQELKFCMELLPESNISYAEEIRGYFNVVGASGPNNMIHYARDTTGGILLYVRGQFSQTRNTLFPSFWVIHASVSKTHNNLSESEGRYSLSGETRCTLRDSSGGITDIKENSGHFHALISELAKLILVVQNEGGTQQQIAAGSKLTVYGVLR